MVPKGSKRQLKRLILACNRLLSNWTRYVLKILGHMASISFFYTNVDIMVVIHYLLQYYDIDLIIV